MIKARASGSKVYLYFMKKGRQARHRILRNSCFKASGVLPVCVLRTDGTSIQGHVTGTYKAISFNGIRE